MNDRAQIQGFMLHERSDMFTVHTALDKALEHLKNWRSLRDKGFLVEADFYRREFEVAAAELLREHGDEVNSLVNRPAIEPVGVIIGDYRDVGGYSARIHWAGGEHPGIGKRLYDAPPEFCCARLRALAERWRELAKENADKATLIGSGNAVAYDTCADGLMDALESDGVCRD